MYLCLPLLLKLIIQYDDLKWTKNTGTLGDTFGGLLSPIIGLVSIYFIYKTFKAQREQLKDQKKTNRATMSSVRLSTLMDDLKRIQGKFNGITYTNHINKGMNSFVEFRETKKVHLVEHLNENDRFFLNQINHILFEIELIVSNLSSDKILTKADKATINHRLQDLLRLIWYPIQTVYTRIGVALVDEPKNNTNKGNDINNLAFYCLQYIKLETVLSKNEYIEKVTKIEPIEDSSSVWESLYKEVKINTEELDLVKSRFDFTQSLF